MLCWAVPSCAVPCCAMLCHPVLCCAAPWCAVLCFVVPCYSTGQWMRVSSAFFSGATVQREYLALVKQSGQLAAQPQGTITDPLRGPGGSLQPAITLYETLSSNDTIALLRLTPQTGSCAINGGLLRPYHTANKSCTPYQPIPPPPPALPCPPPPPTHPLLPAALAAYPLVSISLLCYSQTCFE